MAYKNQKRNKAHIKELRDDPDNWRNVKRIKLERIKQLKESSLTEDECLRLMKIEGLI